MTNIQQIKDRATFGCIQSEHPDHCKLYAELTFRYEIGASTIELARTGNRTIAEEHVKEGLLRSIYGESRQEFEALLSELEHVIHPVASEYPRYMSTIAKLRELSGHHLPPNPVDKPV